MKQPEVHFNLKDFVVSENNPNEEKLIFLRIYIKGKELRYSTSEKVNLNYWDVNRNSIDFSSLTKKDKEIKKELERIQNKLNDIKNSFIQVWNTLEYAKIEPTCQRIKEELNKVYKPEPIIKNEKPNLLTFIRKHIDERKFSNTEGRKISEGTRKNWENALKHLKEFQTYKRKKVDYDTINLDLYNDLLEYMQGHLKLSYNTTGRIIKTLKMFLNEATEQGYNTKFDYKSKRFKTLKEEVDKIYLTESEIEILYKKKLDKIPHLDRVRDLFLIGCYTALRFSDFTRIKPENFYTDENGKFLKITTQKTGQLIVIPVKPELDSIIKKYNGNIPKVISNQKMNKYLKDLGELAKINTDVQITITKGGLKLTNTYKKYKLIGTHTARRTGATNMYLNGIPERQIMKITGHKTESSFLLYLRMSETENANQLAKHPYFKAKMKLVN